MLVSGSRRARPVVGMLTHDLLELFAEQWHGAVDAGRAHGCDFICFCGRELDAPGFDKQANAIYDLVTDEAIDGLIVWTSVLGINVGRDRMEQFCRRFQSLPMVSVEQSVGGAPVVLMENRRGMYAAVNHLIEVHGRRRIAFVSGPSHHAGAHERYLGYLDALARHGLEVDAEIVSARPSGWLPEVAATAVTRMLDTDDPPDAIAAANDDFAVAVLSVLAARGVGTPDVPVVGFDDFTNVHLHDLGFDRDSGGETVAVRRAVNVSVGALALTTVRAPFHEMGRRAVETVLAMLRGETVPDVVTVPTELIVRRSCGCRSTTPPPAAADPVRHDRTVAQLGQALTPRSAVLPSDWLERLSTAFLSEVRGGPPGAFLDLLDELLQMSLGSEESLENWWRVLLTLRRLVGPASAMPEVARAEEIWLHAMVLLNETAKRHWRYGRVLGDKRNHIVRQVGQRLITAADLARLAETLAEELPKLGIPGCYLAAYEPAAGEAASTVRSRLLLAYENGAPVDTDGATFPSALLVPDGRLRRPSPYSAVATPLYFKDQQLGFVIFELGPRIGWIYVALQEQLSTALHRAFLVERERAAVAAVAEAHRREERHRLASELHDSVSQALFSMTLHTRAIQLAADQLGIDAQSRVVRGLTELQDLTKGALTEMRALIFQLRPEALREEGLVAAIDRHAAAVAARQGFDVRVEAPDEGLPLDERAEEELFRVVQEALHNCVKHADPSRVDIRLIEPPGSPGTLVVEVADDGVGFDPDVARPGHLGLESMRERARRLDGHLVIESSPAGSTTVRAVLPGIVRRPATGSPAGSPATDTTSTASGQ